MKVILVEGDIVGAEVLRFVGGGIIVELDNCEEAYLSTGSLNGGCNRLGSLKIGSTLQVRVTQTFQGRGFRNNISVEEVQSTTARESGSGGRTFTKAAANR